MNDEDELIEPTEDAEDQLETQDDPVEEPIEPNDDQVAAWIARNRPDLLQPREEQRPPTDPLDEYQREAAEVAYRAATTDAVAAATRIIESQTEIKARALSELGQAGVDAARGYFERWPQTAFMQPGVVDDVMDKVWGDLRRAGKLPTKVSGPNGSASGVDGNPSAAPEETDFESAWGFKPSKAVLKEAGLA